MNNPGTGPGLAETGKREENKLVKNALKLVCLVYFILITPLYADQQISIAVFPFSVRAAQPNEKIAMAVAEIIQERLEKDGIKALIGPDNQNTDIWTFNKLRQEGIRLGVDRIITGHIFMVGDRISLDASMHNIYENQPPVTFFSQAENMEGLYPSATELGKSIIGELFEKKIISTISIIGNKRVEKDAIFRVLQSVPGEIMDTETLSQDLQTVYKMGFFDDVLVSKKKLDRGVEIIFEVKEKPSVRNISFKSNKVYEDEELFDVVDTTTGSILNIYKINNDVEKIRRLYTEKNYHNCRITYEVKPLKNDQADIIFALDEGEKVKIKSITFDGNKYFSDKELKKEMKTKQKGFWSFLTSSGELDETELDNDALRIESMYKNNGFIDVKVSDARVDLMEESITVSFKINEGEQFKTGKIEITGDILTSQEELLSLLVSSESELYNRELIRKDLLLLNDLYSNQGYANVNVAPLIKRDLENKTVNISFKISKGELVFFNRIIITGNSKTRDKVIRRELAVQEQGRFSMTGIQRSHRNLGVRDYFQNVEILPLKTDKPNQRDLEVKVVEKPTGNFSFGGGFSSDDGAFGQVSVEERNLFGRGQNLKLTARVSSETGLFNIGFTEPWLFDKPISAGFDLYKFNREYDYYDKDALGLTLRAGNRRFWDYTTIGLEYNIEEFEIYNAQPEFTPVTEGEFLTASIKPYVSFDSRNHFFLPTDGMLHKASVEYAGPFTGGEIEFTRYELQSAFFFPLFWKISGSLHAKGGYLDDRTGGSVDIDWERFYLGGINSVRGFDKTDINGTRPPDTVQRGGEKFIQFNAEMMFPIQEDAGVFGVVFYDRGDVYLDSESFDITDQYSSTGLELRWNSPMGPIRLAYGWVIDGKYLKERGEGQFDFSIGAFF